jgi:2,4'-dihydroxyacetophenone dioxygenase
MAADHAQPAHPIDTEAMAWIPTGPGKSFRPLRFEADGWSEIMRLEPGAVVGSHRHTGDVHAYNLSGRRKIISTGEVVPAGGYVYEPPGNADTWGTEGDEVCLVHIKITGAVEYLDEHGQVTGQADAASQRATYLDWCAQQGVTPEDGLLAGG